MKKKLLYIIFSLCIPLLTSCTKGIDEAEVKQLFEKNKTYPQVIDYTMYRNLTETAKKASASDLVNRGLLTVKLSHTVDDVDQPLISLTDAASPYLLTTSDTLKALDAQRIRIAEEVFVKISEVEYSQDKKRATVTYVTRFENITPFVVMLTRALDEEMIRQTSFVLTDAGWEWEKEIVKLDNKR